MCNDEPALQVAKYGLASTVMSKVADASGNVPLEGLMVYRTLDAEVIGVPEINPVVVSKLRPLLIAGEIV